MLQAEMNFTEKQHSHMHDVAISSAAAMALINFQNIFSNGDFDDVKM